MQTSRRAVADANGAHAEPVRSDDMCDHMRPVPNNDNCAQLSTHTPVLPCLSWLTGYQQEYTFDITHEEVVKKRYLTLYNRRIRFPAHADKPVSAHPIHAIQEPHFQVLLMSQAVP